MGNACASGTQMEVHTTTPEICPPEVAKAWLRDAPIQVSSARDVWALGCLLYELLLGRKLLADLVQEAVEAVASGRSPAPPVGPTELLGVLHLISELRQEQIEALVAVPRLVQGRMRHIHMEEAQVFEGSDTPEVSQPRPGSWLRQFQARATAGAGAPAGQTRLSPALSPPLVCHGGTQDTPHRPHGTQRRKAKGKAKHGASPEGSAARRAGAQQSPDGEMWSVVEREMSAMSEILSKMLRIQPQDRIGVSDVLSSGVLGVAAASGSDLLQEVKTMKRCAAENRQQMQRRMLELDAQMKQLIYAASARGSSSAASTSFGHLSNSRASSDSGLDSNGASPGQGSPELPRAGHDAGDSPASEKGGKRGIFPKSSRKLSSLFERSRKPTK
mmetsp:Transcript_9705/g.24677  ORF Transcript_9705/g.24677 Transcript_9705/m.24677 type:complete len:387 (+) Transcript_9705:1-1161(+)